MFLHTYSFRWTTVVGVLACACTPQATEDVAAARTEAPAGHSPAQAAAAPDVGSRSNLEPPLRLTDVVMGEARATPRTGTWQFGGGSQNEDIFLTPPITHCSTASPYYILLFAKEGEADPVSNGAAASPLLEIDQQDFAVPRFVKGSFQDGGLENIVKSILPAGTSDLELSPEDAARPVGTVIAQGTFSVGGVCLDSNFSVTASHTVSVELSAATRPPKPDNWPEDTFYPALQWSWKVKSS